MAQSEVVAVTDWDAFERETKKQADDTSFMLNQLLQLEEGLTPWEVDFVEDLAKQRKEGRPFTDAQAAKVGQIFDARV